MYLDTGHGPRNATLWQRHVGDLGNITTDSSGMVAIDMTDGILSLYNATRLITNRAIVVHLMFDDGGMGGTSQSNLTGYVCFLLLLINI